MVPSNLKVLAKINALLACSQMLAKTIRYPFNRKDIDLFIEQANTFDPTIKFTAEISEKEITFTKVLQ